jgi:hypothetical protein
VVNFKYDDIDDVLRQSIERGVVAIRRINTHENFANWLAVGEACLDMQTAAMRLAHTNQARGRGYNDAFKVIAHEVPDLANLNKTTRGHACWMADPLRKAAVVAWHERLPGNIRQQVNHPTTVWRRYLRETEAPTVAEATARAETPLARAQAETVRLQEELDQARARIRRLERGEGDMLLITRGAKAEEIAAVLRSELQPRKVSELAGLLLGQEKSTSSRPRQAKAEPKAPKPVVPAWCKPGKLAARVELLRQALEAAGPAGLHRYDDVDPLELSEAASALGFAALWELTSTRAAVEIGERVYLARFVPAGQPQRAADERDSYDTSPSAQEEPEPPLEAALRKAGSKGLGTFELMQATGLDGAGLPLALAPLLASRTVVRRDDRYYHAAEREGHDDRSPAQEEPEAAPR